MGQIVLIYWITNISTVAPWEVHSLHWLSPQQLQDLQTGLITLRVTKVGPAKKVLKLDQIEGLMHMNQVVLRLTLSHVYSEP